MSASVSSTMCQLCNLTLAFPMPARHAVCLRCDHRFAEEDRHIVSAPIAVLQEWQDVNREWVVRARAELDRQVADGVPKAEAMIAILKAERLRRYGAPRHFAAKDPSQLTECVLCSLELPFPELEPNAYCVQCQHAYGKNCSAMKGPVAKADLLAAFEDNKSWLRLARTKAMHGVEQVEVVSDQLARMREDKVEARESRRCRSPVRAESSTSRESDRQSMVSYCLECDKAFAQPKPRAEAVCRLCKRAM